MQQVCGICSYSKNVPELLRKDLSKDFCIYCGRITPTLEIKDRTTDIYRYRSNNPIDWHGLGRFAVVRFSRKNPDRECTSRGYRSTLNSEIFCWVLNDPDWSDDWKKAKKQEFKIRKMIDLQKMQQWFEVEKKKPHVKISPLFIK